MNYKTITIEVVQEDGYEDLKDYLNKYDSFSKLLEELVIDNLDLSSYHTFIKNKDKNLEISFTEQVLKKSVLLENRQPEIKKVTDRYIRRINLEERRIKNASSNNKEIYENSLNLLNDLNRRINLNLKNINDSFLDGATLFIPSIKNSKSLSLEQTIGENTYEYKLN